MTGARPSPSSSMYHMLSGVSFSRPALRVPPFFVLAATASFRSPTYLPPSSILPRPSHTMRPHPGQVRVDNPVPAAAPTHPPDCGSPGAHASLRRFASGYHHHAFGAQSRLGHPAPSAPSAPAPPPPPHAFAPQPANTLAQLSASDNHHHHNHPIHTQNVNPGGTSAMPSAGAGPTASNLVFGDYAALHVRQRIERRPVPKRQRVGAAMGVDHLTEMMQRVLTDPPSATPGAPPAPVPAADPVPQQHAPQAPPIERDPHPLQRHHEPPQGQHHYDHDRDHHSDRVHDHTAHSLEQREHAQVQAEQERSGGVSEEVMEEAADELSFLVNRCDLEADSKQSHFMPYIT